MIDEMQEFHGRYTYRVNDVLKRAVSYTLYLVTARQTGQRYTLKLLEKANPQLEQWLRREGAVMGTLDSAHIVRVHDVGQAKNGIFLVMEDVQGRLLNEWVEDRIPLDEYTVIQLLYQMASALKDTEARGVVHRGISPTSIWVCPPINSRYEVLLKLWGFGLASTQNASQAGEPGEGFKGMGFWAPEQLSFEKEMGRADVRTDIYGIGSVAYWLLTGKTPYEAESIARLIANIVDPNIAPISLTTMRSDLSTECVEVIRQCLAKNPTDRFASPAKLITRLEQMQAGSDRLNFWVQQAERAAQRANQDGSWAEVIEICKRAEREKGGSLQVQDLLRLAVQMLEKSTGEMLVKQVHTVRDLIDRGLLQEAEQRLQALEQGMAKHTQISEKLNLGQQVERLRAYMIERTKFKPARLLSSNTENHYDLLKPLLRLGRRGQNSTSDLSRELDLIDFSPENAYKTVSRLHAWAQFRDGVWKIKPDTSASNLTYLNGQPIYEERELKDQDTLRLGSVNLTFCLSRQE